MMTNADHEGLRFHPTLTQIMESFYAAFLFCFKVPEYAQMRYIMLTSLLLERLGKIT